MADFKVDPNDPQYKALLQAGSDATQYDQPYIQSLEKQTAELGNVPKKLQQAFEVGKSNLQQQAAQSLARTGLVRGGRGLAAGRATAIESGRAIAGQEQESQLKQQEALQRAAQAQTSLLGEKKKLANAQAVKKAQVTSAAAEAAQLVKDSKGRYYTTEADLKTMRDRFNTEIATKYANNPEALQAAINAFNASIQGAGGGNWANIALAVGTGGVSTIAGADVGV